MNINRIETTQPEQSEPDIRWIKLMDKPQAGVGFLEGRLVALENGKTRQIGIREAVSLLRSFWDFEERSSSTDGDADADWLLLLENTLTAAAN